MRIPSPGRPGFLPRIARAVLGILIGLLLPSAGWSQSWHFLLRNGDRVTGAVVVETPLYVTITNSLIGKVVLPVAQIEKREPFRVATAAPPASATNKPPAAATAIPQKKLDELNAAYVAGQISALEFYRQRTVLIGRTGTGVPATAMINPAILAKPPPPPGPAPKPPVRQFHGELLAGMDLAFSTKDRQLYNGRLKLNYIEGHLRNALDYSFTYGYTDGELSANRMDGSLKSDYDYAWRSYVYNLVAAGYDEVRKIDSYLQAGPGIGYHFIKLTNFVASGETGLNYQEQNFSSGTGNDDVYFRFAELCKWTINSKFSLDQKLEYFPQWDAVREFKLRFEANIRYWLRSNLSINFTIINLYDTRVALGIEPNDLQIRSSIGVKF